MFYYLYDVTQNKQTYDYGAIGNGGLDAFSDDPSCVSTSSVLSMGTDNSRRKIISIDDAMNAVGSTTHIRLFFGTALLFLVDSMELSILAYLSQALDERVEWFHDIYVAYAGVGGALVGAVIWGSLGDLLGRRKVSLMVSCIVTIFSIVTALLVGGTRNEDDSKIGMVVEGLLVSRFLVGFGLGGITVPYDLLAEWLPNKIHPTDPNVCYRRRAPILLFVHVFWSIGSLIIFGLLRTNTAFSPQEGTLTGIELWWCTLPAILSTIFFVLSDPLNGRPAILESPRFLLARGRHDEALHVLRLAAQASGKDVNDLFPESMVITLYSKESHMTLPTRMSSQAQTGPFARIRSLCSMQWMTLASALLFTYFGQAFCYQGTANMLISVFDENDHEQKYQAGLSALSEVVGIGLLFLLVDSWGRVTTQMLAYAFASLSCLTLAVWFSVPFLENGNVLICLALIARMMIFGGGCVTSVSTTELLTTEIRTTGHAVAGMAGRLGTFAATVAIPNVDEIPLLALIIFAASFWIAFTAGDIPETRMKELGRSYNMMGHSERW